jgi:hypothetical protein
MTLYHQTKDILCVKEFLGHNKICTTLVQIQLVETFFKNMNDDLTEEIVSLKDEIKASLEKVSSTSVKKVTFYTSENANNCRNQVKTGVLD